MRAASLIKPGHVEIVDIPEPKLGPEDVLVEIRYVGLCGSDLAAYRGQSPLVSYPRILGHEVGGILIDKGSAVPERIPTGAKVMFSPYTECGLCPACRAGRPNCCQFNQTMGVQRDGALTERVAVPYRKVYTSEILSLQELALVEPLSVGYHATNRGQVRETDTVLAIGCGTIGIGVISAAVRKGATVIAVDIEPSKLALAQRFGAQHAVNARDDVRAYIAELTKGRGVNVAIEAVGRPETYRLAVDAVCYAGRVVYIGYAKQEVCFDTTEFVRKELDIRGSRNALRVFPSVIQMLEQRAYPFSELISRVYPLEQTAQALADWNAAPGDYAKILIQLGA